MQEDVTEKIQKFVNRLSKLINVQSPAQIKKVNSDGTVNVEVFRNDEIENQLVIGIKIKHLESGRGFIHLGVAEGDFGVVRYFDTSIDDYIEGITEYNYDDRIHDSNDACFELGFVPNPSSYIYPSGEVTIGSKTGSALITINGDNINIVGGSVNLGGSGGAFVLTENSTITDGEGRTCTITSNTTKTKAI